MYKVFIDDLDCPDCSPGHCFTKKETKEYIKFFWNSKVKRFGQVFYPEKIIVKKDSKIVFIWKTGDNKTNLQKW